MDGERFAAIRARVETLYALSAKGAWDDVATMLTDDFRIVEAESLPFGGEYRGKDALQTLYGKVFGFWDDPSLEMHDMTISESNAICILTINATSRHNGERLAMRLCEVIHIRGDSFSGITPYYFDTAAIARATGTLRP